MAAKTWTLSDVENGEYVDKLSITPADVEGSAKGYSVTKRRLEGGMSDGVDSIRVDNGTFAFEVLPTRGMSLWKGWLGDLEVGWKSPVRGPVHPKFVPLTEPSGLGWLDGFDELLVRCGLESNGAPDFDDDGRLSYPLHGRIGNKPAHKVEVQVDGDSGTIEVKGVVEETRFHFTKLRMTSTITTKVGEPGFSIHDEIENFSATEKDIQMLYHLNIGEPILDAGSRLVVPLKTLVPRNDHAAEGVKTWDSYSAPEAGFEEQVYFMDVLTEDEGKTQVLLKNAHSTRGVSLHFNNYHLPCFSQWKNTVASTDGYVTGIEPGTNFPNPRSYEGEQKRVVRLKAGGKISFELRVKVHTKESEIQAAEEKIAKIQGDTKPTIFDSPQKNWSADA